MAKSNYLKYNKQISKKFYDRTFEPSFPKRKSREVTALLKDSATKKKTRKSEKSITSSG
jgi:hypothetical protein